jgi:hypothetical protein
VAPNLQSNDQGIIAQPNKRRHRLKMEEDLQLSIEPNSRPQAVFVAQRDWDGETLFSLLNCFSLASSFNERIIADACFQALQLLETR